MEEPHPAKRARPDEANEQESSSDAQNDERQPIPITLLSGFLGAGKTTMLKHLLQNKAGLKVGVVVNDVAEINIDASLIAVRGGGNYAKDDTVELQNGCACCSASEELLQSVEKLMDISEKRGVPWDHIVIESSGVAEPKEIRDNFRNCYLSSPEMLRGTVLHTLVTVVDGSTFLAEFQKRNKVDQRPDLGYSEFTDGTRQVVDLMCEQIECADVLVVNKTDLISSPEELDLLKETIMTLAPLATVLTSERGAVPLESVLAAAKSGGVAMLNEEEEHHKLIEHVKKAHAERKEQSHDHAGHEHGHAEHSGHEHGHAKHSGHEHGHAKHSGHENESGHNHGHDKDHDHGKHDHEHQESSHQHGHGHEHVDDCSTCKENGTKEEGHDHSHGNVHSNGHDHSHGHKHSHEHEHSHAHKKGESRETKRFGITSFCYQRRRPFHPARLMKVIRQLPVRQQKLALEEVFNKEDEQDAVSTDAPVADTSPQVCCNAKYVGQVLCTLSPVLERQGMGSLMAF